MLDALFPRTKQRVLGLLFGEPDREFTTGELIRRAHAGSGAVQREIERLVASGLITATGVRTQKRIAANRASPLFGEISSIVQKTSGAPALVARAREAVSRHQVRRSLRLRREGNG